MKTMLLFFIGFYIFGASADGFDQKMADFSEISSSRVSFTDRWNANYLNQPIVTKGKLIYIENEQLTKLVEYPESIEQKIMGDKLTIKSGGKTKTIDLKKNEILATGIYALQYILDGNVAKIRSTFNVTYKEIQNNWTIKIVPIARKARKEIKSIRIKGRDKKILVILIAYNNGNSLETTISYDL